MINTHRSSADESSFANKELASSVQPSAINEIEKDTVLKVSPKQQEETKKPEEE